MTDLLEDFLAFLYATRDEPAACSKCGRQLAEGEEYTLDENDEPQCGDCAQE